MVSRFSGAFFRAVLVMGVVATPSVVLTHVSADAQQMVALAALFAGVLTFVEYNAEAPSLIEFRDAPPFNRIRMLMLFTTIFAVATIERGRTDPSSLTEFFHAIGQLIGIAMDFPYSPVRLATLMLNDSATPLHYEMVRDAAGIAYFTSLLALTLFVILLKAGLWPLQDRAFNVWINLPTFDPTASSDAADRLERDGRVNIALGFLLPFVIPFGISLFSTGLNPLTLTSAQTLTWTMTAWSFLPASLFMRGIALGRIAELIRDMRRAKEGDSADVSRASRAF